MKERQVTDETHVTFLRHSEEQLQNPTPSLHRELPKSLGSIVLRHLNADTSHAVAPRSPAQWMQPHPCHLTSCTPADRRAYDPGASHGHQTATPPKQPASRDGPRTSELHPPTPTTASPPPQPPPDGHSPASSPARQPHLRSGRAATPRPRPGFSVQIIHRSGAEGAKLQTVQAHAIREVLQWLQDHPAETR